MIRVWYGCQEGRHELTISGHAGYGPPERDIVCAGVSALAGGLLSWLEDRSDELTEFQCAGLREGDFYVAAAGKGVNTAFRVTLAGLLELEWAYSGFVEVRWDGGGA